MPVQLRDAADGASPRRGFPNRRADKEADVLRAVLVPALILAPAIAIASTEAAYQVSQPIWAADMGVAISDVTYVSRGAVTPLYLVELTVRESLVVADGDFSRRNAAHWSKFAIRPVAGSRRKGFPGVFGDTLRVDLDVSDMPRHSGWAEPAEVLECTIECMILNARRARPALGFLEVNVADERFADYSGVYNLKSVEAPCSTHLPEGLRERLREPPN